MKKAPGDSVGQFPDRSRQVQQSFNVIGDVIHGAVDRTAEDEIRAGAASFRELSKPISNTFGTFTHVYDYRKGCVPKVELDRGIGVLKFMLFSAEGPDVICSLGKAPEGQYQLIANAYDDGATSARKLFDEVFHEDGLPERLATDQGLNAMLPGEYQVSSVHGLINGSRH